MWIARDQDGRLNIFSKCPERCDKIGGEYPGDEIMQIIPCVWRIRNPYGGFYSTWGFCEVDKDLLLYQINITWEDEPKQVNLLTEDMIQDIKDDSYQNGYEDGYEADPGTYYKKTKLENMEKNIEPYYVLNWDFNRKNIEYYDIIPYLIETLEEEKKNDFIVFCDGKEPKDFEDFKNYILNASKYRFWSRCEYEILVSGFPPQDKEIKIDIYNQIEHNINVITKHFMKHL